MNRKIDILKKILLLSTGEYYEINLSEDYVPGIMYQVIDGKKYNINEKLGLSENARFSDVIATWSESVPEEEQENVISFFKPAHLIEMYHQGQAHLCMRYWTRNVLAQPMQAEQHIFMYQDEESDEIWAFTYVLDLTRTIEKEEYTSRLEAQSEKLEARLEENAEKLDAERRYLEVLYRQYILAYQFNVHESHAEVLALNQRAHVWSMPGMWQGATFEYDAHIREFARQFIVVGKDMFLTMLSRGYIEDTLKTTQRYSFRFETIPNVNGNRHYEVQVMRVNPNQFDGRVLIVSEENDDLVLMEQRREAELNTERKYLEVLTEDYVAVYHASLNENISTLIKVDARVDGYNAARVSLRQINNYTEKVERYTQMFVVPEQQEMFRRTMNRKNLIREIKNAARFVFRYQTIQRNGETKYFEVQVLHMNENPESGDVLIAFRDINDIVTQELRHQMELEERWEKEKNQYEMLTALGNSYSTIGRIDLLSDRYDTLRCADEMKPYYISARSATKVLSTLCENSVSADDCEKMRAFLDLHTLEERMQGKDAIETECVLRDGNWHRIRLIAKRRDRDGKLSHVLYTTQLISDEKNREERLISMAEAANEANAAKTEFISKVAHDIRTPMNSLLGFLQIAEANLDDSEKVRYSLQKIRVAGDFLKELVNDVLDISKMENGRLDLNPREISVREQFEELPTSMQGSEFGKKLDFSMNMHDITCDRVIADSLRLKQIYTNILSNAIKYTPDGGKVEFEVYEKSAASSEKIWLIMRIADNGIGMSEEFMKKMFFKFERETDTRLNTVSGYGLGLHIVQQLVALMEGRIEVESELGRGTTFIVKLELPCVHALENSLDGEKTNTERCRGMHLLVAEDNELGREVIDELLQMHGISCETAKNGRECVSIFAKAEPGAYTAILMDIQMPEVNGLEAARRIRALDKADAQTVPIIAMTANSQMSDIQNCLDAGMNRHLSKPVDVNRLLHVLAEL